LDMFPTMEREKINTIDVEMQAFIEWWGFSNCLQDYKIYRIVMKMFITKFLSNRPRKQCIGMEDVHMEMDQAINLAMTWISKNQKCIKLNTSNMYNLDWSLENVLNVSHLIWGSM
jgi:hypothetical protein